MAKQVPANVRVPKIAKSVAKVVSNPACEVHLLPCIVSVKATDEQVGVASWQNVILKFHPKVEESGVFAAGFQGVSCSRIVAMHDGSRYTVRQDANIWMFKIWLDVQMHEGALKAAGIDSVFEDRNLDSQSVWVVPVVVVPLGNVSSLCLIQPQVSQITQVLSFLLMDLDIPELTWCIATQNGFKILVAVVDYQQFLVWIALGGKALGRSVHEVAAVCGDHNTGDEWHCRCHKLCGLLLEPKRCYVCL